MGAAQGGGKLPGTRGAFGKGMKGLFSSVGRLFGRIVPDAILLNEIPSPTEHQSARTFASGRIRWAGESFTFLTIGRVEAHPWPT